MAVGGGGLPWNGWRAALGLGWRGVRSDLDEMDTVLDNRGVKLVRNGWVIWVLF